MLLYKDTSQKIISFELKVKNMRFLQYKLVIGEKSGGEIYSTMKKSMLTAKEIDESYKGPEFLWVFYQLGDYDRFELTLLKWEVWSSLRPGKFDEMNNAAFVGPSAGIFFYYIDEPDSFESIEEQIKYFISHSNSDEAPVFVVCLFDAHSISQEKLVKLDRYVFHNEVVQKLRAQLVPIPIHALLGENSQAVVDTLFRLITFKLQPKISQELNIASEFWKLSMDELRYLLTLDKIGRRPRPRLAPPEPPKPKVELVVTQELEAREEVSGKVEDKKTDAIQVIGKIDVSGLSEAELKKKAEEEDVAITKEGELIKIIEVQPEVLVDLSIKGAIVPRRYPIPRHCPKCGNYRQTSIREDNDPTFILLDYPRIYGIKYICGICGNEWRKTYELD